MKKLVTVLVIAVLMSPEARANEIQERITLREEYAALFENESYEELHRIASKYLADKELTGSGTWKLVWFHRGIHNVIADIGKNDEGRWESVLQKVAGWQKEHPESAAPIIAHGNILLYRGGLFRGSSYSSKVEKENMDEFRKYASAAADHLIEHYDVGSRDPFWYTSLGAILRHFSGEQTFTIMQEGIERYPDFDENYFSLARALNPKWHGSSIDAAVGFAKVARDFTTEDRGDEMYARVLWSAGYLRDGSRLLLHDTVDWEMMVRGMNDVIAKHPAQWNINYFGNFSCFKGDMEATRRYLEMVEEPIVDSAWDDIPMNYQKCRLNSGLAPSPNIPMPKR